MMPPKCYTWLESCGSQLSDGKNKKLFFCILHSVGFSMTLRTDIFLYTEKLSFAEMCIFHLGPRWLFVVLQVNGQTINTMELAANLTRGDNRAPIECRYVEAANIGCQYLEPIASPNSLTQTGQIFTHVNSPSSGLGCGLSGQMWLDVAYISVLQFSITT